jgi:O-antigen ligase
MFYDTPSLLSLPLLLRIVLFFALLGFVYRYTKRDIQNGVLIGLITGITPTGLFRGWEILPGLPNISIDRIVWPVVFIMFLLKRRRGQTERLTLDWTEWGLLAFITVMLVSMISYGSYIDEDGDWSLFSIVRGYVFPFMAYSIVRRAAGTARQFHRFVTSIGFFTLYLALTGFAEILKIQPLVFPRYILNPEMGIHFGSPRGIFLNASTYGLAIATALPLLVWLYCHDRAPRRYMWVLAAGVSALPLLLTFQRAAWLSAIVASGVTALAWPKRRVFLTGSLLFLVMCGFWLTPSEVTQRLEKRLENQTTIDYRLMHIERGLAMFKANPLFGVGVNRYGLEIQEDPRWRMAALTTHAHNTWITLLAELGLVGILAYVIPFGFVLFKSSYGYLRFPQHRALFGILVAITLAFLAMSLSIDLRISLYSNGLLFTLWGMILARLRKPSDGRVFAYTGLLNREAVSPAMLQHPIEAVRFRSHWP